MTQEQSVPQDELAVSLLTGMASTVQRVLGSVAEVGAATSAIVAAARRRGRPPRRGDLAALRPLAATVLRQHHGFVAGTGVVLAPDVLADASRCIEWWWTGQNPADREPVLAKLEVDLDPESAEFYDYTTMQWYREPQRTGGHSVAGPYVDYICTHEYTFTVSVPVVCAGRFAGVAAADILAEQVERTAAPWLSRLGHPAVLASGEGRVIASNTGNLLPGMVLARGDAAATLRPVLFPAAAGPGAAGPVLPWTLFGQARPGP
jgi:hypothetical protein